MDQQEKPALATVSVVLSIGFGTAALLLGWIPLFGAVAIPLGIVSLITGWLALKYHKTAAVVGMTLAGLGVLLPVSCVGVAAVSLSSLSDPDKSGAEAIRRESIESIVETAKARALMEGEAQEGQPTSFNEIQPYMVLSGKTPNSVEELAQGTGSRILSLGTYSTGFRSGEKVQWGPKKQGESSLFSD